MESHKGPYFTKGSWQGNDLMDIRVTVFWPGLNFEGAVILTMSQRSGQTTKSSKQAGRLKLQLEQVFCSFHSKSPWLLQKRMMLHPVMHLIIPQPQTAFASCRLLLYINICYNTRALYSPVAIIIFIQITGYVTYSEDSNRKRRDGSEMKLRRQLQ